MDVYVYPKESSGELTRELKASNTKDSMFDRIYRYYHNNKSRVVLTAEEHDIRERWEKAWFLLCRHRTRRQVADLLEKIFSIGKSVAYDDIRNAMMLFSNPQEDVKAAKRAIHENMVLQGADRCWKNGDMDGYYKFTKEYREGNNLDNDDDDKLGELLKKLKPAQIIIFSNARELEDQANEMQQELTNDVEYKDAE